MGGSYAIDPDTGRIRSEKKFESKEKAEEAHERMESGGSLNGGGDEKKEDESSSKKKEKKKEGEIVKKETPRGETVYETYVDGTRQSSFESKKRAKQDLSERGAKVSKISEDKPSGRTFISKEDEEIKQVSGKTPSGEEFKLEGEEAKRFGSKILGSQEHKVIIDTKEEEMSLKEARERDIITKSQFEKGKKHGVEKIPVEQKNIGLKTIEREQPDKRSVPDLSLPFPLNSTGSKIKEGRAVYTRGSDLAIGTREEAYAEFLNPSGQTGGEGLVFGPPKEVESQGLISDISNWIRGTGSQLEHYHYDIEEQEAQLDFFGGSKEDVLRHGIEEAKYFGGSVAYGAATVIPNIAKLGASLVTDPVSTVTNIPAGIKESTAKFGLTGMAGQTLGQLGVTKGISKVAKAAGGKIISKIKTRDVKPKVTGSNIFIKGKKALGETYAVAKSGKKKALSTVKSQFNILDDQVTGAHDINTFIKNKGIIKETPARGVSISREISRSGPQSFSISAGGLETAKNKFLFGSGKLSSKIKDVPQTQVVGSQLLDDIFTASSKKVSHGLDFTVTKKLGKIPKTTKSVGVGKTNIFRLTGGSGGGGGPTGSFGGGSRLSVIPDEALSGQGRIASEMAKSTAKSTLVDDITQTSGQAVEKTTQGVVGSGVVPTKKKSKQDTKTTQALLEFEIEKGEALTGPNFGATQVEREIEKTGPTFSTFSVTGFDTQLDQDTRSSLSTSSILKQQQDKQQKPKTKPTPKQKPRQEIEQTAASLFKQKTGLTQRFKKPTPAITKSTFGIGTPVPVAPTFTPSIGIGFPEERKERKSKTTGKKKTKSRKEYKPSLVGMITGTTRAKPSKATGFGIRYPTRGKKGKAKKNKKKNALRPSFGFRKDKKRKKSKKKSNIFRPTM